MASFSANLPSAYGDTTWPVSISVSAYGDQDGEIKTQITMSGWERVFTCSSIPILKALLEAADKSESSVIEGYRRTIQKQKEQMVEDRTQ